MGSLLHPARRPARRRRPAPNAARGEAIKNLQNKKSSLKLLPKINSPPLNQRLSKKDSNLSLAIHPRAARYQKTQTAATLSMVARVERLIWYSRIRSPR